MCSLLAFHPRQAHISGRTRTYSLVGIRKEMKLTYFEGRVQVEDGDVAGQGEGVPVGVLNVRRGDDNLLRGLVHGLVVGAGGDLDAVGSVGTVGGGDDGILVEDVPATHVEAVNEQEDEVGVGVGRGLAAADNPARSPLGVLGHHVGIQDDTVLQGGGVRLPS